MLSTGLGLLAGGVVGRAARAHAQTEGCGSPPSVPEPFAPPDWQRQAPALHTGGPIRVTVSESGGRFRYEVAGQPTLVRGMGYNPRLAGQTLDARRGVLERDFYLMRAHGVDTVFGWDPAEFDGLTLDVASEAGLGVALPFDFDFSADFRQASARLATARVVRESVIRYREHPALRLWALGNEVLQRMVPPIWCSTPPTVDAMSRARAFARFLVELADEVRSLDPLHPVIYRESEDAYVGWIADALAENPGRRPWLIYGINAYTARLAQILDDWPGRGIGSPVLVSEFATIGATRGHRAPLFRDQWAEIRSRPDHVLGGAVYVWYADGPEEVDQAFGLVDPDGQPVDDALGTIGELYLAAGAGRSPERQPYSRPSPEQERPW